MDVSKYLAKVIGIYLIIVGVAMLANMHLFLNYIHSLINNAPLMYVIGFFTLIPGILMVVSHNVWQWNWRLLITLISWLVLLKGASIILFPKFIDKTSLLVIHDINVAYVIASFDLILGLIVCYFGFRPNRIIK